jgi:outer membrane immunogenic protein
MSRSSIRAFLTVLALGSAPVAMTAENDWSGLYLGANVGGARGAADEFYPFGAGGTPITIDTDGIAYGGHAGYQIQRNSFVIGFEASYGDTTLEGADTVAPTFVSCRDGIVVCRVTDVESLVTVGTRLGYATEQWLLTASGGFAGADISTDAVVVATGLTTIADSQWHNGWYAGAGVEYAMAPDWSIGLEYLHVDLGEQRHGGTLAAGNQRDVAFDMDIVRARLSYNFGG